MLTHITIQNLVTLQELNLELSSGTTVITGETGAGKSILIDAIEFALGSRATGDVVRQDQDKAEISLTFDISQSNSAREWLKNAELLSDEDECIIRRSIHRDGRSRSFINGVPTTLQLVREFSEILINIHGQHEHQTLLKHDKQREILDEYAGHDELVNQVKQLASEWNALNQEIADLKNSSESSASQIEFLKFQLHELENINLQPNEFHTLDLEHKQLSNADELLQNLNAAIDQLTINEEQNAAHLIHEALHALQNAERFDPKISGWIDSLKNALIHMNDAANELQHYLDHVELDPERLKWIEGRISTLFNIARKHKVEPEHLLDFQQKLSEQLFCLEKSDERIAELTEKLAVIKQDYLTSANKLSNSREKFSKKLAKEITQTIRELSLLHAEFHVAFERENHLRLSPHGLEKITFEIKTHTGQSLQPLAKIASGGELSRISLAIHLATAEQYTIPVLIFDEVDVGVSGGTAEIIGKLLRRLGESHQVLCITHLAQVAAQGHHHLRVEKIVEPDFTRTHIQLLTAKEKINELARLLGGIKITKKTLDHAKEMLEI